MKRSFKGLPRLCAKLCLFLVPVLLYFCLFAVFEPYNYFGFKSQGFNTNQPIYRVRSFTQNPQNAILLGDSRMAHLDGSLITEITSKSFSNLAFGGASQKEITDLFWYAVQTNPNIDTVYLEVSFYTLNQNYAKDRVGNIKTIVNNPFAYLFNLDYNLEMLNNMRLILAGTPTDFTQQETATYTNKDYTDDNGNPLPYRRQLLEYARTIYPNLSSYSLKDVKTENLESVMLNENRAESCTWQLNQTEYVRLLQVAEYCRINSINLTFVLPPVDDAVTNLVLNPLGISNNMLNVVNALKSTGANVLDFEITNRPDFDESMFFDGFHLDTERGLPIYTRLLFADENK